MNTPLSTEEQAEFAEIFGRLERDFRMSKAEVARALRIERSYVSMLVKGQRTPRRRILEAMRGLEKEMAAGREPAAGTTGPESELNRVIQQLKALERADRTKFELARHLVDSLSQTTTISSKPGAAATKLLKKAAASVQKRVSK